MTPLLLVAQATGQHPIWAVLIITAGAVVGAYIRLLTVWARVAGAVRMSKIRAARPTSRRRGSRTSI